MDVTVMLGLYETDKPAFILAVADLREQRAKAATPGPWVVGGIGAHIVLGGQRTGHEAEYTTVAHLMATQGNIEAESRNAEHIAAEANPAHALAAVRRWRGVVERHKPFSDDSESACREHLHRVVWWCCPDLIETADEARAYLGSTR